MRKPYHTSMTSNILYSFKKQYGGGPITIYQLKGEVVDLCTGEPVQDIECTEIECVVVMPASLTSKVVQNVSKISADRRFAWGGNYDVTTRGFIVDRKDVPDLSLTEDDWIIWDDERYNVKNFFIFEEDAAWVIITDHIRGHLGCQCHCLFAEDTLLLSENHAEPTPGSTTLAKMDTCKCHGQVEKCCYCRGCSKSCIGH